MAYLFMEQLKVAVVLQKVALNKMENFITYMLDGSLCWGKATVENGQFLKDYK